MTVFEKSIPVVTVTSGLFQFTISMALLWYAIASLSQRRQDEANSVEEEGHKSLDQN
jgi:uncharacterized membrane protein YvlD (DUF360 family)